MATDQHFGFVVTYVFLPAIVAGIAAALRPRRSLRDRSIAAAIVVFSVRALLLLRRLRRPPSP